MYTPMKQALILRRLALPAVVVLFLAYLAYQHQLKLKKKALK